MKYTLILFILFLLLIGCRKQNLDTELEKSIILYQGKVPIPNSNNLNGYLFIYIVEFSLIGNDTIATVVRRPSGIPKALNYYGIYEVNDSIPVVIYDEKNLGKYFINNKIRNSLLLKYQLSKKKRHFVDYPPVYSYVVRKNKINFLKIDTISEDWKK